MGRHRPLGASFRFAWDGLAEGAVRDRNLRIHLACGALAGAFAAAAPLAPAERALLVLCVAAVVAAEALNSALEAAVDLASPGPDERARFAKDAAAGAVLALAAGSALALLAIATPRAAELAARARALGPGALLLGAGAVAAAGAAGLLPGPGRRPVAVDLAVGAAGVLGLAAVARAAESQAGTAVVALCLAVGVAGAARRRGGRVAATGRRDHSS
jgi:diacylglycerol kinase (ATP)